MNLSRHSTYSMVSKSNKIYNHLHIIIRHTFIHLDVKFDHARSTHCTLNDNVNGISKIYSSIFKKIKSLINVLKKSNYLF